MKILYISVSILVLWGNKCPVKLLSQYIYFVFHCNKSKYYTLNHSLKKSHILWFGIYIWLGPQQRVKFKLLLNFTAYSIWMLGNITPAGVTKRFLSPSFITSLITCQPKSYVRLRCVHLGTTMCSSISTFIVVKFITKEIYQEKLFCRESLIRGGWTRLIHQCSRWVDNVNSSMKPKKLMYLHLYSNNKQGSTICPLIQFISAQMLHSQP